MQAIQVQSLVQEELPGEGNDNPLEHSCPENPMDRGAWLTTVHGVAQSWTQLNRLSVHESSLISTYVKLLLTLVFAFRTKS